MLRFWFCKILVLRLVCSYEVAPRPRVSFPGGSPARALSIFTSSDVSNYSVLLLSADADTLFVGARDAVISLDVSQPDNMTLSDELEWTSSEDNLEKCQNAQKEDCGNFIRVLQFFNSTHLFVCGTNAYGPQGLIIAADSLNASRDTVDAKNCCPYSSTKRNTAVIVDEELYTATNIGYFHKQSVITRCISRGTQNNLVLDSEPELLNGPEFISSTHISSEGKVLLFFREAGDAINDLSLQSFTVSRVAQVCTDDNGGDRVLQKRWTSFAKAQLVCQQQNKLQFNILQDIVTLSDSGSPDTQFYAVFTSEWSLSSGLSAVCAFSLKDIKSAFSGDYKTFQKDLNYWSHEPNSDGKLGKCGLFNDSDNVLNKVKTTFLTKQAVHSVGKKLLLSSTQHVYSRVAVQRTVTAVGKSYIILYLLTESGFLHKVVLLPKGPHIIEEIQVFKHPQTVKSLLLSTSKAVLFLSSSEGVFSVPVSSCSVYPNCAECVLARDPFCGWDSESRACTAVSSIKSNLRQDVENGNIKEQCEELKNRASAPLVTLKAQLNEFVVLPCKSRSNLAKMCWRFPNGSVVSQFPYVVWPDGSLSFSVTPDTENVYSCVSEELGFLQTISSVSVVLSHQKSYYTEMVVFCLLFLLCICVFVVFIVRRQSVTCNKNGPQNRPKASETENICRAEREEKRNPKS